jgi:hypothetical protein
VNIIYLLAITPAMAQAPMKLVIEDFQIAEPLTQLLSTQVLSQQFKEIAKAHSQKYQIVPSKTEIQEMMSSADKIPEAILREWVPEGILTPHVTVHQQQLIIAAKLLDSKTFQPPEFHQVVVADCIVSKKSLCLLWQQFDPQQDFFTPTQCSSYPTSQNLTRFQIESASQLGIACQDNRRWDCDSRKGDTRCQGTLIDSSELCFLPQIMKKHVPFESGTCLFGVFLEILDFPGYYKPESPIEIPLQQARRQPTCFDLSRAVNNLSEISYPSAM